MSNIFFSIVLPTFDRLETIKKVILPSLEIQTFDNYELVIVDDFSNDGTEKYFSSDNFVLEFPNLSKKLKYIRNSSNLGSPKSRNIGFVNSNGEWIFMVEDDLEIKDSEFLSNACEIIKENSIKDNNIAVFSPKREEFFAKGYYKNFNNSFINYGLLSKELYLDPSMEYSGYIENTHACSFIRTEIAKKLLYDFESYSYFREESDFYERVKINGFKIYYLGDRLKTFHRMDLASQGGNRKHSVSVFNEIKYLKSHYTFMKKYFNFAEFRILFFVTVRLVKHLANLSGFYYLKNLLSYLKL